MCISYMQVLETSISVRINNCKNIQPPMYLQHIYIQMKESSSEPQMHRFKPVYRQAQCFTDLPQGNPGKDIYIHANFALLFKNPPL